MSCSLRRFVLRRAFLQEQYCYTATEGIGSGLSVPEFCLYTLQDVAYAEPQAPPVKSQQRSRLWVHNMLRVSTVSSPRSLASDSGQRSNLCCQPPSGFAQIIYIRAQHVFQYENPSSFSPPLALQTTSFSPEVLPRSRKTPSA